jgi:hypothetical protein
MRKNLVTVILQFYLFLILSISLIKEDYMAVHLTIIGKSVNVSGTGTIQYFKDGRVWKVGNVTLQYFKDGRVWRTTGSIGDSNVTFSAG